MQNFEWQKYEMIFLLGKDPKIKKCESMIFDHTPLKPSPPLTLTIIFLLRILKICTKNGQINITKSGMNKDMSLDDPPPLLV